MDVDATAMLFHATWTYAARYLPGRQPARLVLQLADGEELRLPVPTANSLPPLAGSGVPLTGPFSRSLPADSDPDDDLNAMERAIVEAINELPHGETIGAEVV